MKRRLVLLDTRDHTFDRVLTEAVLGTGAVVLIARSVGDALQIICRRARAPDFALLDFDGGCRGMTLLSAAHTCYQQLPVLVTTSAVRAFSPTRMAPGTGLKKPLSAAGFAKVIADVTAPRRQPVAA
jgi:hypothetical protein